jgi:hypothetical protein
MTETDLKQNCHIFNQTENSTEARLYAYGIWEKFNSFPSPVQNGVDEFTVEKDGKQGS